MIRNLTSITLLLIVFTFSNSYSQSTEDGSIALRLKFWENYEEDPDLAVSYARKLAKIKNPKRLKEALHDGDVYGIFLDNIKNKIMSQFPKNNQSDSYYWEVMAPQYQTLQLLVKDKEPILVKMTMPLYLFATIQQNINNRAKTISTVNRLIENLKVGEAYANNITRYALFAYHSIIKHKVYDEISNNLLNAILMKLKAEQKEYDAYNSSDDTLEKRSFLRYNYASANYFKAKRLISEKKVIEAGIYFNNAALFSPDIYDQDNLNDELDLIGNGKNDFFEEENLKYLFQNKSDHTKILNALSIAALNNPIKYKSRLKEFYIKKFPNNNFNDYWLKQINGKVFVKMQYQFKTFDEVLFASTNQNGKWVLIDFWGTWCTPCRAEHPEFEKNVKLIKENYHQKIVVATIATRDTEQSVNAYMNEHKYTFPVALYNDSLNNFSIEHYPTKVLITPQGKSLKIPNLTNWYMFVKEYANL